MPIAVTEDHESLRTTALRWAQTHSPATVPRQAAEAPPGAADLPAAWEKMAAQGWLGLHLPEDQGGQGFTLSELAVVRGGARARVVPRAPVADPGGLRGGGPRVARAGHGAARVGTRAGRRHHHRCCGAGRGAAALAAGGGRGARPGGLSAPGARAAHGPAGAGAPRRRHRCGCGCGMRAGSCSTWKRWVTPSRSRHCRRSTPRVRWAADHRRGRRDGAAGPAGAALRPRRPRPGPHAGGGRERRDRPLVPGDGIGVRQGARPIRPTHRPVPGGEARAGGHAGRGRAERGGGLGRRGRLERGRGGRRRTRRATAI